MYYSVSGASIYFYFLGSYFEAKDFAFLKSNSVLSLIFNKMI